MKNLILLLAVFTIYTSSLTAQTKKELKEQKAIEEYETMKVLINSRIYVFNANWISTTRGQKINISAGSNSIAVAQDSTKAAMQFFGEVNSIRFSGNEGVEFNNIMSDYQVNFNEKKKNIIVSYRVKNKAENYHISMTITRSGNTYVDVYSNIKRNVTYDGKVSAIKIE